jgi:hypothetical protein
MICPACREAAKTGMPHVLCAGDEITALPGANARTWCDCQHQTAAGATSTGRHPGSRRVPTKSTVSVPPLRMVP